jgi:hypothetical protein
MKHGLAQMKTICVSSVATSSVEFQVRGRSFSAPCLKSNVRSQEKPSLQRIVPTLDIGLWTLDFYDRAMPRFVVLLHETPVNCSRGTHFDLMLEHGAMLRTWALDRLPAPGETVMAERLVDHRPMYLDYEGDVAGDRGQVRRVDSGEYEAVEETPMQVVVKIGGKLAGVLTLTQDQPTQRWRVSLSAG